MNNKERIELHDTPMSMIIKLSEGNPGAAVALMDMVKHGEVIDPDSAFGGLSGLISLDSFGIYGTDIYVLWNDICDRDTVKTLAVLRATQLGMLSQDVLRDAAHRQDRTGKQLINVEDMLTKVQERLPSFGLLKPVQA